jgi:hypothetical protein
MVGPDIRLSSLLKEKYIELDLQGKDKKKILAELVDFIAGVGKIKDKKEILSTLVKREKLGSTGIGSGVAIPHARSAKVKDFIGRRYRFRRFGRRKDIPFFHADISRGKCRGTS